MIKNKIIFICGSLEPGKDGVGDYTRRLGGELIRQDHQIQILGLFDKEVKSAGIEIQCDAGVAIKCLRIPLKYPASSRYSLAKAFIDEYNPKCLSLQFVSYSFHKRGLPFGLAENLKSFGKNLKWHLMFHELWIGHNFSDGINDYLIGYIQKNIIKKIIFQLSPIVVHTTTKYYQSILSQNNIQAQVLPVFSNLGRGKGNNKILFNYLPDQIRDNRDSFLWCCLFGRIGSITESVEKSLKQLKTISSMVGKKLCIIHVGINSKKNSFSDFLKTEDIDFFELGFRAEEEIVMLFSKCDIGLTTYSISLASKSGSISAMLYNDLPVCVLNQGCTSQETPFLKHVNNLELNSFLNQKRDFFKNFSAEASAKNLSKELNIKS
ncbi:hypothetical protein C7S20_08350 [Christiangramia fulva]|uniref:Glycosyl transferase family 1 domain-containing protein n=1 Tax=Christiangramia fulva TaxID=2126553 RepID=A0A2R3Z4W3_9FLAO|nr:hypothetical protein [Christiangramia fulva]AVR45274.1 hypothetical protein C7S20_08350 [Christiangramia fulva]